MHDLGSADRTAQGSLAYDHRQLWPELAHDRLLLYKPHVRHPVRYSRPRHAPVAMPVS